MGILCARFDPLSRVSGEDGLRCQRDLSLVSGSGPVLVTAEAPVSLYGGVVGALSGTWQQSRGSPAQPHRHTSTRCSAPRATSAVPPRSLGAGDRRGGCFPVRFRPLPCPCPSPVPDLSLSADPTPPPAHTPCASRLRSTLRFGPFLVPLLRPASPCACSWNQRLALPRSSRPNQCLVPESGGCSRAGATGG